MMLCFPADPSDAVSETTHGCGGMTPLSLDDPNPGLTVCTAEATPTSLSNHTFLHGDMLVCHMVSIACTGLIQGGGGGGVIGIGGGGRDRGVDSGGGRGISGLLVPAQCTPLPSHHMLAG